MEGSCLCGAVTVHIPRQTGLELCHCTHCRRQCGTGTFLAVPPSDLLVSGELATYVGTSDAGNELRWYWCPICGGKVYQTSSGFGDVSVHAGLFPPGSLPAPNREIWLRSAEPWRSVEVQVKVEVASTSKSFTPEEIERCVCAVTVKDIKHAAQDRLWHKDSSLPAVGDGLFKAAFKSSADAPIPSQCLS